MPWWSWILIWGGLGLALLGMLVFFAIRLFRKAMATAGALEELATKTQLLMERSDEVQHLPMRASVFEPASVPATRVAEGRARRAETRQRRRDSRIRQARLLAKADPARFSHLIKRT